MIKENKLFLDNSIRETLLRGGHSHAAMVLDALYTTVLRSFNGVLGISAHLLDNGIGMGEWALREGLRDLVSLGLLHTRERNNRLRGRPLLEYQLPAIEFIKSTLGIKKAGAADWIPLTAFQSVKEYRKALFAGFFRRLRGIQIGRKKLGSFWGISARTTYTYQQEIHPLLADAQFGSSLLTEGMVQNIPTKEEKVTLIGLNHVFLLAVTERPMTLEEKDKFYSWVSPESRAALNPPAVREEKRYPYFREMAQKLCRMGVRVYKSWQEANYYRWDREKDVDDG